MQSLFLTDDEVAELTGIKRARNGVSRQALQCQLLREKNIQFFTNIKGEPKICRDNLITNTQQRNKSPSNWQPAILSA